MLLRSAFNIAVIASANVAIAQPAVQLFGQARELHTDRPIAHATIIAMDLDRPHDRTETPCDTSGRYSTRLAYGVLHKVEIAAEGYVTRHVLIDLRDVPHAERIQGFDLLMDPTLFKPVEGLDHAVFAEEPTGICLYDRLRRTLIWDDAYITSTRKMFQAFLDPRPSADE